ncbi:MAG: hypothetical protein ACKV0T_16550 [Planctomycetales bacterium]
MDERGRHDQTLVVCMEEFGRAPLAPVEKRFAGSIPRGVQQPSRQPSGL